MLILRLKTYNSTTIRDMSIGAAIGSVIGGGINYYRYKDEDSDVRRKKVLLGAGIGAGLGGGSVLAGKYAKKRYDHWLGADIPKPTINTSLFKKGDIVKADRGIYKHYGVVVDDKGTVIEFGSDKFDPRKAGIHKTTLSEMSGGSPLSVEKPDGTFTPELIVQRAEEALKQGTRGQYNIRYNNCEHFAREIVNGKRESTLVTDVLGENGNAVLDFAKNPIRHLFRKSFSQFNPTNGDTICAQLFRHFVGNNLFNTRKNLTRELGGLSNFNKYLTTYLAGAGSIVGGLLGRQGAKKKAEEEAEEYGLKKGSFLYNEFLRSRMKEGAIKGALLGGAVGFGASKGVDTIRGKVIHDKALVMFNGKLDLGTNHMANGKALRGITSELDVKNIAGNWKETSDYAKAIYDML